MILTKKLPVLFLAHGSPMNAIEENSFTRRLSELGNEIPKPRAILCVSAHWLSSGTWITAMQEPKTIHDFYGFPKKLHQMEYPAPGSPKDADFIRDKINEFNIHRDESNWGLDHGTWSVLTHVYPKADIPVLQLSIDMSEPGDYHYKLGQELRKFREQGFLIVGSGNITHNLRQVNFQDKRAHPLE